MKEIENAPVTEKYALIPRQRDKKEYTLDFVYSDKLEDIEEGIKETTKGMDTANLVVALAIARIDQEALYVQAGCKSYLEYLDTAEDRLNMSRQSISNYKLIGVAYIQYKNQLKKIGYQEQGNLHKLRFLEAALQHHQSSQVFKRLMADSLRKFAEYAIGLPAVEHSEKPVKQYIPDIRITPKMIIVDGKNILRLDPGLDETIKKELIEYLKRIYEIKGTGNIPYILNVYDDKEARTVENYLKRRRGK